MTAVCRGTKRDGEPCAAAPMTGERWCWHHHPDLAEERRRNAATAYEYERNYQLARLQPPGRETAAVRGTARQPRRDEPLLRHHRAHDPCPRVLFA